MDAQNGDENFDNLGDLPMADLPVSEFPDPASSPLDAVKSEEEAEFPSDAEAAVDNASFADDHSSLPSFEGMPEGEINLFEQSAEEDSPIEPQPFDSMLATEGETNSAPSEFESPQAHPAAAAPQISAQLKTGAFTVKIPMAPLTPLARAQVREFLTKMQISLSDTELSLPFLSLSHLSEFKTIQLQHFLKTKRVNCQIAVLLPGQLKSDEENLALGVLGEIDGRENGFSLGAPRVDLPKSAKEIVLCTGSDLSNFEIKTPLGVVSAHKSLARTFFHDADLEESMLRNTSNPPNPGNKIDMIFQDLFSALQKKAHSMGANAVFALQVNSFPESYSLDADKDQMRLVVIGTACIVEERNAE